MLPEPAGTPSARALCAVVRDWARCGPGAVPESAVLSFGRGAQDYALAINESDAQRTPAIGSAIAAGQGWPGPPQETPEPASAAQPSPRVTAPPRHGGETGEYERPSYLTVTLQRLVADPSLFENLNLNLTGIARSPPLSVAPANLKGPALPPPAGNHPCAVAKGSSMRRLASWLRAAALLGYKAAPGLRAYMWALAACSRARGPGHTGFAAEAHWTLSRVKWRRTERRLSKPSHRRADLGATRERCAAAPPAADLPAGSHARGPGNARGHYKRDRDQRTMSTRTRTQQRPRRRSLSWLRD